LIFFDQLEIGRLHRTVARVFGVQIVVLAWVNAARRLQASRLESFDNLRQKQYIGAVSTFEKTAINPDRLFAKSVFALDGRDVVDSSGPGLTGENLIFLTNPARLSHLRRSE
jgi:hypothetical protein